MRSAKTLVAGFVTNIFFLAILLISAGRLAYWPAWVYAAIGLLMSIFTERILRRNPNLTQERLKPGPGSVSWDKKLLGLGFLLNLAMLVVAGLDAGRYHWFPRLPLICSLVGVLLSLAGMGVFLLAMRENRFFSSVIRIQSDRGHAVCQSGPYRYVRHPGNAGMILGTIGLPLLFGSAWSAIPAFFSALLLVVRTYLEDVFLASELSGYSDYQHATPYRLIPRIW